MAQTLLVTVTVYSDNTRLAYSFYNADTDKFTAIQQTDDLPCAWAYLTQVLPDSYSYDATIISVIDRRPGTRATSRCCGHSMLKGGR